MTRRNNRYLDELKATLEDCCGVVVSESTIWRTLNRVGFCLKEVSFEHLLFCIIGYRAEHLLDHEARYGM